MKELDINVITVQGIYLFFINAVKNCRKKSGIFVLLFKQADAHLLWRKNKSNFTDKENPKILIDFTGLMYLYPPSLM